MLYHNVTATEPSRFNRRERIWKVFLSAYLYILVLQCRPGRRTRVKIMVADDDRDMVDMLSYWLKGHGYDVVRAFDGEQAIKRWRETLPDLVILDIQMPKLDGFEVCRQMRMETNSMVLMLTAHDREDDEVRGLELGADDYLRKPFSPKQLLARIKALMRRSNSAKGSSKSSAISVGPVTDR